MKVPNVFYHVTRLNRWKQIKKEGVLWGVHGDGIPWEEANKLQEKPYRYTYLSPIPHPPSFGSVVLRVEYKPQRKDFGTLHNFGFDPPPGQICTQFSVFEPIPLSRVRRCFWLSLLYVIKQFVFNFKKEK